MWPWDSARCACLVRAQALWGDALMRVEEGLAAGRRWLWDEASRRVGVLLAAPSAFQGEHFLQVRAASALAIRGGRDKEMQVC